VDFTQRLHGLTFKDALKHLGLEPGKPPKVDGKEKRKRELIRQFRQWEREKYRELTDEYRLITQIICRCKTMEEVSNFAGLMHEIPILEYKMDVLTSGTDEAKYGLYRASF
jgi:hypothetical protein